MRTYRLNIGDIRCIVVQEAAARAEVATWHQRYTNTNESEFKDALEKVGHEGDTTPRDMNALYIETGGSKILVDVGFGEEYDSPEMGLLIPNLRKEGIAPEDIDIVFITHFHGDHYAGLLKSDGKPSFPNAHYITQQSEWDYWMSAATIKELAERADNYVPIFSALQGKFSFVNDSDEIAPGVRVVDTPGHTLGHSGLSIESNGEQLIDVVDILHHTTQFAYPGWHFVFDTDGVLGEKTRRAYLDKAAANHTLTLFYHLPFPGLGYVRRDGDAFKWEPIDS